jgi:uncharacterized protein (TIGR00375 family)
MKKIYADLHIHSPFSLATSKKMDVDNLELMAQKKGIDIIATGDIFHPEWQNILKTKLLVNNNGFYKLKNGKTNFILSGEVSLVFGEVGKKRKVHVLILCKNFEETEKLTKIFSEYGKLKSNGRPFLKMSLKQLSDYVEKETKDCFIIAAHIWTPHYSLFGSKSGFNSLEEAFEGKPTDRLIAMETGLSSDPPMNWLVKDVMKYTLVSNSDSHSPLKIGREVNVFQNVFSFDKLVDNIKTGNNFLYTIEFFPEEGKYFYDGHRKCGISLHPEETFKQKGICPACNKKLTVGVLNRVYELSKIHGKYEGGKISFKYSVPLIEVIAAVLKRKDNSPVVLREYYSVLDKLGKEFYVLEEAEYDSIKKHAGEKLAKAINLLRENNVRRIAGFDGQYGKILFE